MMLLQPGDVGAQRGLTHLNTPVIAIDALGPRQRRLGIVDKELHVRKQRALVGFEGQYVIPTGLMFDLSRPIREIRLR